MTGIVTELNAKIKNMFVGPFWNTISPDNALRLYVEYVRKIDISKTTKLDSTHFPSKVIFGVSPKLYKKILRKKDTIKYQLKNDLLNLYLSNGYAGEMQEITIDFVQLSYLSSGEVRVFTHKHDGKNSGIIKYSVQRLNDSATSWILKKPGIYFIGRGRKTDICINNPYVSLRQAKIDFTESGLLYITDCRSTNKTYINNDDKPLKEKCALSAGDKIYFGKNKKEGIEILHN